MLPADLGATDTLSGCAGFCAPPDTVSSRSAGPVSLSDPVLRPLPSSFVLRPSSFVLCLRPSSFVPCPLSLVPCPLSLDVVAASAPRGSSLDGPRRRVVGGGPPGGLAVVAGRDGGGWCEPSARDARYKANGMPPSMPLNFRRFRCGAGLVSNPASIGRRLKQHRRAVFLTARAPSGRSPGPCRHSPGTGEQERPTTRQQSE
jgi:hypothetical protein